MSHQNTLEMKRVRRIKRRERHERARAGITITGKPIKHCGIRITKMDVAQHFYRSVHRLAHSERCARFASFVGVA